jgi:hypothetical protein
MKNEDKNTQKSRICNLSRYKDKSINDEKQEAMLTEEIEIE